MSIDSSAFPLVFDVGTMGRCPMQRSSGGGSGAVRTRTLIFSAGAITRRRDQSRGRGPQPVQNRKLRRRFRRNVPRAVASLWGLIADGDCDVCALNSHDERGSHRSGALTPAGARRAFGGGALVHAVCQNRCVESDDVDRPRQVEARAIPGGQFPGDEWRRVMRLWLVGRGSRGGLQGRPIRPKEGQHTVEATNDCESAFVHGTMMASAQQHEVVEARGASIGPAGVPSARNVRVGVECST